MRWVFICFALDIHMLCCGERFFFVSQKYIFYKRFSGEIIMWNERVYIKELLIYEVVRNMWFMFYGHIDSWKNYYTLLLSKCICLGTSMLNNYPGIVTLKKICSRGNLHQLLSPFIVLISYKNFPLAGPLSDNKVHWLSLCRLCIPWVPILRLSVETKKKKWR